MARLSWIARGVLLGDRNRHKMALTGKTPRGDLLWSKAEEAILRQHFGKLTYRQIAPFLPGRTVGSIGKKATNIKLTTPRHRWTARDVSVIRKLYQKGTWQEIDAAFPNVSRVQVEWAAARWGFYRPRRPYVKTGILLVDEVRDRAFEIGYTMHDLDEVVGTPGYWKQRRWQSERGRHAAVMKAIKALNGRLELIWDDDQYG